MRLLRRMREKKKNKASPSIKGGFDFFFKEQIANARYTVEDIISHKQEKKVKNIK